MNNPIAATRDQLLADMYNMGRAARHAATLLARSAGTTRDAAIRQAAEKLRNRKGELLEANRRDLDDAAASGAPAPLRDRLLLDEARVESMATALEEIAQQPDPLGVVIAQWQRPNGLVIQRVRVPLGVIGMIYESRPNVTCDAGALCLKAGNAVILRGGSESFHSNQVIHRCLAEALRDRQLPAESIQLVPTTDRTAVGHLLTGLNGCVDVIVPRGGKALIARVQADARVPVMGHLQGLCHVYVHAAADAEMARRVVLNAKMRRTGICGAAETLLIDRQCAAQMLPLLAGDLLAAGCELRGDPESRQIDPRIAPATEEDWRSEYLDAILSVRVVEGIEQAMEHIRTYGSGHTESIVTADAQAAERFLTELDSAILLHNASTQFADGGEFGMGAEIGIATGRIHARGPVGVEQLTSYKYIVRGNGQLRP